MPRTNATDDHFILVMQELGARPDIWDLLDELIKEAMPAIERGGEQARQQAGYEASLLIERLVFERRCRDKGVPFNPFLDRPIGELRVILKEARRLHEGKLANTPPASRLTQ